MKTCVLNTISALLIYNLIYAQGSAFVARSSSIMRINQPIFLSSKTNRDDETYENLKAIIFDVDGTLSDSWKLGFDATQTVLKRNGIGQISEAEYHEFTRYCTPDRLARHAGLQPSDEDFKKLGRRLGSEFDDLYIGLVSLDTAGFFLGVKEFLETMPDHIALGALTNACVAYADAVFDVNLPGDHKIKFASVHGADSVPEPKPSPEGLWLVCKELGVKPEECVYVGDSPSDAAAAKNAGMKAIGVTWGSHGEQSLQKAQFDHLCGTIDELKALLPQALPVK